MVVWLCVVVRRLSVLDAITSAQQKLKLFSKVPNHGLVLYTGTVQTEEGKEKRMAIAFEPLKPINKSFYLCDSKFHTEVGHPRRHEGEGGQGRVLWGCWNRETSRASRCPKRRL